MTFFFPHLFMSVHLCTFLSVLPVYVHRMYVFLLSLLLLDGILLYWIFVCFCCAAPDKLTSPPPFTGLGALHFSSVAHRSCQNQIDEPSPTPINSPLQITPD